MAGYGPITASFSGPPNFPLVAFTPPHLFTLGSLVMNQIEMVLLFGSIQYSLNLRLSPVPASALG